MTYPTKSTNVPPENSDDKPRSEGTMLGGRATDADRMEIDFAAARLGARRAHFMIAAALEIAEAIKAGDDELISRIRVRIEQVAA